MRLDSAERMRAGGDSGPVIVPHKPEESLLIAASAVRIARNAAHRQAAAERDRRLREMDLAGCPDPRSNDENPSGTATAVRPIHAATGRFSGRSGRRFPRCDRMAWARSDLDRFVLEKLEAAGLAPSPQADPRTLLRRLYYDLIGLPPTAEELAAFEADPSDARYEAAVDWLLASPRFGERWARYWLDVARYADTKGYVFTEDRNYKHAYSYRDWVIGSFNGDRPYDEFIVAQLAADQIEDPKSKPAMGFLTLGRRFLKNPHDIIDDRIDVVTRGLMGLTVACARCHDHKYDPIPTADYYALYGVFASSEENEPRRCAAGARRRRRAVRPGDFSARQPGQPRPKVDRHFLSCLSASGEAAGLSTRQRPARTGRGDRQPRQSADGPRVGQPRVGPPVRRRPGGHAQRLRHARHAADASRAARLAGLRVHGTKGRLVDQAADSQHRDCRARIGKQATSGRSAAASIRRTGCCGVPTAAGSIWKRCATACSWRPGGST